MLLHSDVAVVALRSGSGHEKQMRVPTSGFVGSVNERVPDSLPLEGRVHGKVRQIRAEREIGDRPRHADETTTSARGHDDVGLPQHLVHALDVVHRTTRCQS